MTVWANRRGQMKAASYGRQRIYEATAAPAGCLPAGSLVRAAAVQREDLSLNAQADH